MDMIKKLLFLVSVIVLSPGLFAQSSDKKFVIANIGFYNLENLFDTIDSPDTDDAEFLPNGINRWDGARYNEKLKNMAYAISQIGREFLPIPPMILGVSEIENKQVLVDLTQTETLKPFKYGIVHYDSPDKRGVDVGLIYQTEYFKLTNSRSHRLNYSNDTAFRTRDQLVVSGLLIGEPIHIIVCHWPSRSGGEARSRPLRVAAAQLTRHIIDSIEAIDPNAKIVMLGDLNDDPTNESMMEYVSAKGEKSEVTTKDMYNPYYNMFKKGTGSLAFRDAWDNFDQIVVSPGLLSTDETKLNYYSAKIYNADFLTQTKGQFRGYPKRTFSFGVYQGGYSDHYPVYILLVKKK
jgi:hypothetical protein